MEGTDAPIGLFASQMAPADHPHHSRPDAPADFDAIAAAAGWSTDDLLSCLDTDEPTGHGICETGGRHSALVTGNTGPRTTGCNICLLLSTSGCTSCQCGLAAASCLSGADSVPPSGLASLEQLHALGLPAVCPGVFGEQCGGDLHLKPATGNLGFVGCSRWPDCW
jgi:hypothetical protein